MLLLRFIGSLEHSAAAQAAYAVGYTELFSLITWTSVGLMGAAATIAGQNLGAGKPERALHGVAVASRIGLGVAAAVGALFLLVPGLPAGGLRHDRSARASHRHAAAAVPRACPASSSPWRSATPAACRAPATRAARSTSRSCRRSSCRSACARAPGACAASQPADIWLAIVLGHVTRAALSVLRFRQGKWRSIAVDIEPARP